MILDKCKFEVFKKVQVALIHLSNSIKSIDYPQNTEISASLAYYKRVSE